jgi:hypothetical protein
MQTKRSTNHQRELSKIIKKTPHVWGLAPEYYQNRSHHWRENFSVWYQHKKRTFSHLMCTGRSSSFFFFTSAVLMGVQMGDMSKLGWPNGPAETCGWISCISCMWRLVQSGRPSLHSHIFCGLLHTYVGLILIFQADLGSGYICAP